MFYDNVMYVGFPSGSAGRECARNVGDPLFDPWLGRSLGKGNGYPLQYSSLENAMHYTIRGVAKSQTRLSDFHFHYVWLDQVEVPSDAC